MSVSIIYAQDRAASTSLRNRPVYKSNSERIGVGMSLVTGSYDGAVVGPRLTLEYGRHIKGKFFVGGTLRSEYLPGWMCALNAYEALCVTTLTGNAYWELPVAGKWLSFRCGGGMGIGYVFADGPGPKAISPYMNLRVGWVVRCSDRFELTFAPLIFGPTQVEWSPFGPVDWRTLGNVVTADLFSFGFGFRF